MNGRARILAMLDGQAVDRLPCMPITMMFAATHAGIKYGPYARDYRQMVAAQLRTAEAYEFDHVSIISDPGVEAADCGAEVVYYPDQPPAIDETSALLADKTKLARLKIPDPLGGGRMHNRVKAVELYQQRVNRELLVEGWIEGPCAEGADLRGINTLMLDFFDDPGFVRDLFEFVLELELRFAKAQLAAGADLIGIGDAAASLVGPKFYREVVFPYEKKLVAGIKALGGRTRLHICGNMRRSLDLLGHLGCDMVDIDYLVPLDEARAKIGPTQVLLGNIDPVRELRNSTPERVYAAVAQAHRFAGEHFIVGPGCEVPRDTPPENLRAMLRYAKDTRD